MKSIVADINEDWLDLSASHAEMRVRFDSLITDFKLGKKVHPSYLVSGIYGSGKTTFLVHIVKNSIKNGIVPIYLLADDLVEICSGTTPQQLKVSIDAFVEAVYKEILNGPGSVLNTYIKPGRSQLKDTIYNELLADTEKLETPKYIVLVDEMEDRYNILKERTGLDPLRLWLEDSKYLKFLALTPSGIHDLGGADESRLSKDFRMPHVSLSYIRETYKLKPGHSNLLWWISRGIPRQIIKNMGTVLKLSGEKSESVIYSNLKALDRIGKDPGVIDAIYIPSEHRKIRDIVELTPHDCETYDGFRINSEISEGELSEAIQRIFDLKSESSRVVSLLIAKYFRETANCLSDKNHDFFVPVEEVGDFLKLSIDSMLDSEYRTQEVQDNLTRIWEIDNLPEKNRGALVGGLTIGSINGLEYGRFSQKLPFTISEIRGMFPFIISDPVIKSSPSEVLKRIEGQGAPIVKGEQFSFLASMRDLNEYSESNQFRARVLSDGRAHILLVPESESSKNKDARFNPFINWLLEAKKVSILPVQNQIARFLLSTYDISEDHEFASIQNRVSESDDVLIKRKFSLYSKSLLQSLSEARATPFTFFSNKGPLKGSSDTWGKTQLGDKEVAIAGLSMVFLPALSRKETTHLVKLRDLFKTKGKAGKLAELKVSGGRATLADDILPRSGRKGEILDSNIIDALRNYWNEEEQLLLRKLANIIGLDDFQKIGLDEDQERFLEALWRVQQNDFELQNITTIKSRITVLKSEVNEMIDGSRDAKNTFALVVTFGALERIITPEIVKGLDEFLEIEFDKKALRFLFHVFGNGILQIESKVFAAYNNFRDIARVQDAVKADFAKFEEFILSKDAEFVLKFLQTDPKKLISDVRGYIQIDSESELASGEAQREMKKMQRDFMDFADKIYNVNTSLKNMVEDLRKLGLAKVK